MPDRSEQSTQDTGTRAPDFAAFLLAHTRGRSHDELSAALREVVLAVQETGKTGKLAYSLTITPQPKTGAVLIADQIKTTVPQFDRPESIFFATEAGDLVRHDPRQTDLFHDKMEISGE